MAGRTIDEMRGGSKYDTVSAGIIYLGNDAGWSMDQINEMLVKAGRDPMPEKTYNYFLKAIGEIRSCSDPVKRQNAINEWACRNETSLVGLQGLIK